MAIAAVGGAANQANTNVTTLTVTYSPTAGNTVLLFFNANGAFTALTVQDNHGNTLTAGPTVNNVASFYQTNVPAATTSYTATWTTGRQCSLAVEEYSGAPAVNPVGNTASGTSTTGTVTLAITASNNFIVCGAGSPQTMAVSAGTTLRQQTLVGNTAAPLTLCDNTSASVGNVTCTVTLSPSSLIGMIALEIGGTGKDRVNQDLTLVVEKKTSAKVRVNQDFTLVVEQRTTAKVRVNQDLTLVIVKNPPRAQQLMTFQLTNQPVPALVRQQPTGATQVPTAARKFVQPQVFVIS